MQNILIILLGNRDIQLSATGRKEMKGEYYSYFEKNVDGGDYYVIDKKKANEGGLTFMQISELIWEHYDYFVKLISFELYEKTMQVLNNEGVMPDKIVITTSNQPIRHAQDCFFVAQVLERYIQEQGIPCEIEFCTDNPNEFDLLVPFYSVLFRKNAALASNLYISNTGGTPTMRSASHFAGLFQGYRYISINPSDANESKVYQKQENQVLKQVVEKMLNVNDYQGILNLPVSEEIKGYCEYALNLYNFSITLAVGDNKYESKTQKAISNLYWNMIICYRQGRYADAIGRIFRVEECIGQYLLFKELVLAGICQEDGTVLSNKNKMTADAFFENQYAQIDIFTQQFPSFFVEKTDAKSGKKWYFSTKFDTQSTPFKCGKQFWYFFFVSAGKHEAITHFFAGINNQYKHKNNPLVELRNKSILGHGVEGISKADLESVTGDFEDFAIRLKAIIEKELGIPCKDDFAPVNEEVMALLG